MNNYGYIEHITYLCIKIIKPRELLVEYVQFHKFIVRHNFVYLKTKEKLV